LGAIEKYTPPIFLIAPDLIKNWIFITELPNLKGNNKYESYRYYVTGLNIGDIGGIDYTVKLTIGVD
jgi:hypothetical protein